MDNIVDIKAKFCADDIRLQLSYLWLANNLRIVDKTSFKSFPYLASKDLTLNHINGQTTARGFLVFAFHITSGIAHSRDYFIEGHKVFSITI